MIWLKIALGALALLALVLVLVAWLVATIADAYEEDEEWGGW
jgi:hypothetical protein